MDCPIKWQSAKVQKYKTAKVQKYKNSKNAKNVKNCKKYKKPFPAPAIIIKKQNRVKQLKYKTEKYKNS